MIITQKQLLGFIAFITFLIYYLISYDYLIIRLGPSTQNKQNVDSTKKEPTLSLIPKIETPTDITDSSNIKQANLSSMKNEDDKQDFLLTPADQRAPTTYEAALNEATEPVEVLNFPIPIQPGGIDRFQNISSF